MSRTRVRPGFSLACALGVAAFFGGCGSESSAPEPSQSPPPPPNSTTAAPSVPEELIGTWVTHIATSDPAGRFEPKKYRGGLAGKWSLDIAGDGSYVAHPPRVHWNCDGPPSECPPLDIYGTLHASGEELVLEPDTVCTTGAFRTREPALYTWSVKHRTLTFEEVQDECHGRPEVLGAQWHKA